MQEEKCHGCGSTDEIDACPFAEEIGRKYRPCCKECRRECAADI